MNSKNRPPLPRHDVTSCVPEIYCLIDTESHKESKSTSKDVYNNANDININYHFHFYHHE